MGVKKVYEWDYEKIAQIIGKTVDEVRHMHSNGTFDMSDLRSVALFITWYELKTALKNKKETEYGPKFI